jgi:hypothetical protein
MVDIRRPDIVLIDGENKRALVIQDTVVPLALKLPKTKAEKNYEI